MPPKFKFTREQIIQTALELTREGGIAAVTAKSVGARLNSSVKLVFGQFSNMEELKKEVYAEAERVYKDYERIGLTHPIPFLGTGLQYIRFAKEEPELYRLLFLTPEAGFGGAMSSMAHLQEMVREPLMGIYKLNAKTADFYFRELWLVVHSLSTLIVTGDCPYSEEEISRILTGFSVSIYKSIKEIPGFVDGTFDRDAIFRALLKK